MKNCVKLAFFAITKKTIWVNKTTIIKWIWKVERFFINARCDRCRHWKKVEKPERSFHTHECPVMGYKGFAKAWPNCRYYEKRGA